MNTPNRVCEICKRPYYACNPCLEFKGLHWKKTCCSPECFKVYMTKQLKSD